MKFGSRAGKVRQVAYPPDANRKLAAARAYSGKTLRELAAELGYSESHWSAVERGVKNVPKPAVVERVAQLTGVPLEFIATEGFSRYEGEAAIAALEAQVAELAGGLVAVQRTLNGLRGPRAAPATATSTAAGGTKRRPQAPKRLAAAGNGGVDLEATADEADAALDLATPETPEESSREDRQSRRRGPA